MPTCPTTSFSPDRSPATSSPARRRLPTTPISSPPPASSPWASATATPPTPISSISTSPTASTPSAARCSAFRSAVPAATITNTIRSAPLTTTPSTASSRAPPGPFPAARNRSGRPTFRAWCPRRKQRGSTGRRSRHSRRSTGSSPSGCGRSRPSRGDRSPGASISISRPRRSATGRTRSRGSLPGRMPCWARRRARGGMSTRRGRAASASALGNRTKGCGTRSTTSSPPLPGRSMSVSISARSPRRALTSRPAPAGSTSAAV